MFICFTFYSTKQKSRIHTRARGIGPDGAYHVVILHILSYRQVKIVSQRSINPRNSTQIYHFYFNNAKQNDLFFAFLRNLLTSCLH